MPAPSPTPTQEASQPRVQESAGEPQPEPSPSSSAQPKCNIRRKETAVSKTAGVLKYVAVALLLVAIVYILKVVTPMYAIETGSMEPTLPTKSIVLIHEQPSYEKGEVITFHADKGEVVTHRLIDFNDDSSYVTKGDANPTPDVWDDPIEKKDVLGKVIYMTPVFTLAFWRSLRGIGGIGRLSSCVMAIIVALRWRVDDESEPRSTARRGVSLATQHPAYSVEITPLSQAG